MPVDVASQVKSVHHPRADFQKGSEGLFAGYGICLWSSDLSSLQCGSAAFPSANSLRATWLSGVTELGSSGGGLFTRMNNKDYLVGQLSGGLSSCSNTTGTDYYGRFDLAYNAALHQWLGASSPNVRLPGFRMYNTRDRIHFYTADPVERDYLLTRYSIFNYEGVGFYAYAAPSADVATVHRFYNNSTGAHFYTINDQERQAVQANFVPPFSYDGVAWFASTAAIPEAKPMYRFYNRATKTHFYTISEDERNFVQANFADEFQLEGIAYYAWAP